MKKHKEFAFLDSSVLRLSPNESMVGSKIDFSMLMQNDIATMNESSAKALALASKRSSTVMNRNLPRLQNEAGKRMAPPVNRQPTEFKTSLKFPVKAKGLSKKKMF